MNTFLLVISFILHVVSFLCIVLLYFRIERMRDIERTQASIMKDMEDLLSSYVLEIKEENEKFLQEVKQNEMKPKKSNKKQTSVKDNKDKKQAPVASIDTVENQLSEEDLFELLPSYQESNEETTRKQKKNSEKTVMVEQEREKPKEPPFESLPLGSQVKILHDEGRSVEEIAKRLNKGKTEIELFLKFNQ